MQDYKFPFQKDKPFEEPKKPIIEVKPFIKPEVKPEKPEVKPKVEPVPESGHFGGSGNIPEN